MEKTQSLDEIFNERILQDEKKYNLVILGIPESKNEAPDIKKDEDSCEINNIFAALKFCKPIHDLVNFRRIGKIGTNPRPILLKFYPEDIEKRIELLRLAKNLRNLPDGDQKKRYFIKPDLTWKQQQAEKQLVEELKKKRLENVGVTYYIKNNKICEGRSSNRSSQQKYFSFPNCDVY